MKTTEPNPITYPARAINGGHPRLAEKKRGAWGYEPKYNDWRALIHTPTARIWNRHLEPLSIKNECEKAMDILQEITKGYPHLEWLDCGVLGRRHSVGKGSIIIFDFIPAEAPEPIYAVRKARLMSEFDVLFYDERPMEDSIFTPPLDAGIDNHDIKAASILSELWEKLAAINKAWDCDFYEGLVAKKLASVYPAQLRNPDHETSNWVKHRFVN